MTIDNLLLQDSIEVSGEQNWKLNKCNGYTDIPPPPPPISCFGVKRRNRMRKRLKIYDEQNNVPSKHETTWRETNVPDAISTITFGYHSRVAPDRDLTRKSQQSNKKGGDDTQIPVESRDGSRYTRLLSECVECQLEMHGSILDSISNKPTSNSKRLDDSYSTDVTVASEESYLSSYCSEESSSRIFNMMMQESSGSFDVGIFCDSDSDGSFMTSGHE